MDEAWTRPRSTDHAELDRIQRIDPTKGELVRYFAWGYLSRRELNERLRNLEARELHSAA